MKNENRLKEAKEITSSLEKTKSIMQRGIPEIEATMFHLSRDGEMIKSTVEEHSTHLKMALSSTKTHLHAVKRAELWEKYSLNASLLFFCCVVFYIVSKRTRIIPLLIQLMINIWNQVLKGKIDSVLLMIAKRFIYDNGTIDVNDEVEDPYIIENYQIDQYNEF